MCEFWLQSWVDGHGITICHISRGWWINAVLVILVLCDTKIEHVSYVSQCDLCTTVQWLCLIDYFMDKCLTWDLVPCDWHQDRCTSMWPVLLSNDFVLYLMDTVLLGILAPHDAKTEILQPILHGPVTLFLSWKTDDEKNYQNIPLGPRVMAIFIFLV